MFLTIEEKKVSRTNPYYSPNLRNIEEEFYDDIEQFVTLHKTREEFRDFLAARVSFAGNMRHFAVEEISPKIKTIVELDF